MIVVNCKLKHSMHFKIVYLEFSNLKCFQSLFQDQGFFWFFLPKNSAVHIVI